MDGWPYIYTRVGSLWEIPVYLLLFLWNACYISLRNKSSEDTPQARRFFLGPFPDSVIGSTMLKSSYDTASTGFELAMDGARERAHMGKSLSPLVGV